MESSPNLENLTHYLRTWWYSQGQMSLHYQPWPPLRPTHQEQVGALVALLEQDARLTQMGLCNFLGTPEGALVEAAVEAAIPWPYRLVVQDALMVICRKQGARQQTALGLVTMFAGGAVLAAYALSRSSIGGRA